MLIIFEVVDLLTVAGRTSVFTKVAAEGGQAGELAEEESEHIKV